MYNVKYKLNKREQSELFIKLAKALGQLQGPTEMAEFIKDLLSEAEVLMLARRLQIAELLIDGFTYEDIRRFLKASNTTIVKIQTWLELYGDGYRTVIKRSEKQKDLTIDRTKPFSQLKRKYPLYFWPQLLLEELVKTANKREKERLIKIIGQMKEKTQLSNHLTKLLQ